MRATDPMPRVRVEHHLEIAICPLERIDELGRVLHVDIVVHHPVYDE
jgi:hypothetical protein